jgi:hypothetical protein
MADFAQWATAAETALGWERGTFTAAYAEARRDAVDVALDASPIADPLRQLLDSAGTWQGKASELLDKLAGLAGAATKHEDWPRKANSLSAQLRRLAPDFRRVGISVRWLPRTKEGRIIVVEKFGEPSSPSSPAGEEGERSSPGCSPSSPGSSPHTADYDDLFRGGDDGDDGDDQSPDGLTDSSPGTGDGPYGERR